MTNDAKRLGQSLLTAYGLIRSQTVMICDLTAMLTPLIKALENDPLGEAFFQKQSETQKPSAKLKRDSLAVVDGAIRRLRADLGRL